MCGEHWDETERNWIRSGSSPHVRGALPGRAGAGAAVGIIPACAGSTWPRSPSQSPWRDHPRMCGEHRFGANISSIGVGSSPHVRGALPEPPARQGKDGIIPACAGSTVHARSENVGFRDHPRMCGEHNFCRKPTIVSQGSSPHVRGARPIPHKPPEINGIIPACAGSTVRPLGRPASGGDHPRMCGEHLFSFMMWFLCLGSSPHVRGARCRTVRHMGFVGIIPACAGSTWCALPPAKWPWDHPRMCGEHDGITVGTPVRLGSSPHVRGAPHCLLGGLRVSGIIPACAGSTRWPTGSSAARKDHPRMCGEHTVNVGDYRVWLGSSPHVRGARSFPEFFDERVGIIPACAGSTQSRRT